MFVQYKKGGKSGNNSCRFRDWPHNRQIKLVRLFGFMGGVQGSEAELKADASKMQGKKDQQQDDGVVVGIQWCGG